MPGETLRTFMVKLRSGEIFTIQAEQLSLGQTQARFVISGEVASVIMLEVASVIKEVK